MKQNNTEKYNTQIQLKLPVDMERINKISDPISSFDEVMEHIDLNKYFIEAVCKPGRQKHDRVKLLKIVLFAFMEFGYCSVRDIKNYAKQISVFCGCWMKRKCRAT